MRSFFRKEEQLLVITDGSVRNYADILRVNFGDGDIFHLLMTDPDLKSYLYNAEIIEFSIRERRFVDADARRNCLPCDAAFVH